MARSGDNQTPFGKISESDLRALTALSTQKGLALASGNFEISGVKFSSIGAEIPEDLPLTTLQSLMTVMAQLQGSLQWIVGDLVSFGETKYGDVIQWSSLFHKSKQTIYNWSYASRQYPQSSRRKELSFKHHQHVQALDDRFEWLQKAVDARWSAAELRRAAYPLQVSDGLPEIGRLEVKLYNLIKKGANHREMAKQLRALAAKIEQG
jgi:hypothetical protein